MGRIARTVPFSWDDYIPYLFARSFLHLTVMQAYDNTCLHRGHMAQTNCRIDKGIYDRLNSISELTSVPISRLIGEACESWLDSKGVVKLASVYEEIQRMP